MEQGGEALRARVEPMIEQEKQKVRAAIADKPEWVRAEIESSLAEAPFPDFCK
jgi:hypothetical protein